ncbi:MAG: glycosyltransferase [Ignavibacteria bacterium]|nr:glycosyltransferase [Ignavibacteria bacterium]
MPKLTLSMIVKNEEKSLRDCLHSVKDVVDEIILVDTGSTDNTIKIGEEYGGKIYSFEWVNDFSAARNFALSKTTGDWILYLDADERLDNNSVSELRKIISNNSLAAHYCTVKSYDSEGGRDNSLQYTRLFHNSPDIKFEGKVHEQIESSLIVNKYRLLNSNILIHHIGYDISIDEKQKKALRNLALLKEEYKLKQTAYSAFQLAQSYNILEDVENARKYFEIAGESAELENSLRAHCYSALSLIAHSENQVVDAEKYIQISLKLDASQSFSELLASKIALRKGDYLTAETKCNNAYQLNQKIILGKDQARVAIYLEPEEVIYFGLVLALQNNNASSFNFYNKELSSYYNRKDYKQGTAKLAVLQKLFSNSTLNINEEKMFVEMANKNTLNLLLYLYISNPDKQQTLKLSVELIKKFPNSIDIKKILAKLLDELGKSDEAIQLLEKTVESNQYDPSILFYLISFYLKKGESGKINYLVSLLENKYSNIPEVVERVSKLKNILLR